MPRSNSGTTSFACWNSGCSAAGCARWTGPSPAFSANSNPRATRRCSWPRPWPAISSAMAMSAWISPPPCAIPMPPCRCRPRATRRAPRSCRRNCCTARPSRPGSGRCWPAPWSMATAAVRSDRWCWAASASTCVATGITNARWRPACASAWPPTNLCRRISPSVSIGCFRRTPTRAANPTGRNWPAPWRCAVPSASSPADPVPARPPPWCACWRCSRRPRWRPVVPCASAWPHRPARRPRASPNPSAARSVACRWTRSYAGTSPPG